MKKHEGSIKGVPKSVVHPDRLPERFNVGEPQLLRFSSLNAHSHKVFELEEDKAYEVMNGHQKTSGFFDTEFSGAIREKGTVKLLITTAHKSSLWVSERGFLLEV